VARYFPDIKHMCGDAEQRTYIVKFFARWTNVFWKTSNVSYQEQRTNMTAFDGIIDRMSKMFILEYKPKGQCVTCNRRWHRTQDGRKAVLRVRLVMCRQHHICRPGRQSGKCWTTSQWPQKRLWCIMDKITQTSFRHRNLWKSQSVRRGCASSQVYDHKRNRQGSRRILFRT
jgi:hypothetical protein